ncbi:MAG: pseudouridylate synthase [Rhodocyclaceae bacterium]|nr:MAG: pseudouridylate synthase [Rhodocyclaceae bacterium]
MLPILYRDGVIVAINKPAGLLVHRSNLARQEERFAVQLLRDQIGQRVYPVHRLDRGTSGILVFALNPAMARELGAAFMEKDVVKRYLAVVRGHPPERGEIDHPLSRIRDAYESAIGDEESGTEPQTALTRYRRLAIAELPYPVDRYATSRYALLALEPVTGRRHQLRRHLKHISHPIIGDATYGKGKHNRLFQQRFNSRRLLLACTNMAFTHPVTGETLCLHAPIDGEFASVLAALQWPAADMP